MIKALKWMARKILWLYNPAPRRIKIVDPKTGGYVLDIRGRIRDRKQGLINRQIKEQGGQRRCTHYQVGITGSVEMSGTGG